MALAELGFYTLAGQADQPRELINEVHDAEELGLAECFVSERLSTKEAATICGAVGAASRSLEITTAATNHNTRHPLVTAAFATTMHRLTAGRFTLGIGRGAPIIQHAFGMSTITTAEMEDFAGVMRRLFHGETIFGHSGPIGSYPVLRLDPGFDEDIKLGMVAFGPNSLALGGRAFDKVVLHTFFSDETLARCVGIVKTAAEAAGRDPASVRVWSCLATVSDELPEETRLRKTVGRLATYLQAYGDLMVSTNGWDPSVLQRFREDQVVQGFSVGGVPKPIDSPDTEVAKLEYISGLLPDEWLAAAATGSPENCAATVRRQLDLGADGVILHGVAPSELRSVVRAYASAADAGVRKPKL
jgi:probable F420-dependent oxidoreductase